MSSFIERVISIKSYAASRLASLPCCVMTLLTVSKLLARGRRRPQPALRAANRCLLLVESRGRQPSFHRAPLHDRTYRLPGPEAPERRSMCDLDPHQFSAVLALQLG